MIPESLAFTFVAGVPPAVGLHAAVVMGAMAAVFGAQPGVISGAAGATAVVWAPLVASHGLEYLFAGVLLAGVLQGLAGVLRLGKFIRLVPRPVMLGFVNGLALLIGLSQIEQFKSGGAWLSGSELGTMVGLTAVSMGFLKIWPRVTKAIPAPLASIAFLTALAAGPLRAAGVATRTVGDLASVAGGLPAPHWPAVPLRPETLLVILPYAVSVAAVGLIETLLTQQLVDEMTGRRTETHTECIGQGAANVASGLFGTMGGCGMIAQSVINVKSGGRTRMSGLTCAASITLFVLAGSSLIEAIPLAALVGVMLTLVVDIFDWTSFKRLTQMPKTDSCVLLLVTAVTYLTNLAVAVFSGVVLAALGFAWKSAIRGCSAQRTAEPSPTAGGSSSSLTTAVYRMQGPVFFGSTQALADCFRFPEPLDDVVLDFKDARVWDSSGLEAVAEVAQRLEETGKTVCIRGLSPDCKRLLGKAGDLVALNVLEDPKYGVLADYPASAVDRNIEGLGKMLPTITTAPREEAA
jgi:SulP family sulfate permease